MLVVDDDGMPRTVEGQELKLPPKERAVLVQLLSSTSGIVRKSDFASGAWSGDWMSDESLARVVSRLRRVLRSYGYQLLSRYGLGYELVRSEADPAAAVVSGVAPGSGRRATDAQAHLDCEHARQLLVQRTPEAVSRCLEICRGLTGAEGGDGGRGVDEARLLLAEGLVIAIGWGQVGNAEAIAEGMRALDADVPAAMRAKRLALRGALLDMAWRFEEADVDFAAAGAAGSADVDVLLHFARHLLCMDRPALAIDVLKQAQRLAPHALHARMTLARALVQGGRGADAVEEVRQARRDHPHQLVLEAFSLAIEAMVAPRPELEQVAQRMTEGVRPPPFAWSVLCFVQSRLGKRAETLDIVDTALLCSSMQAGEAALYAAPLAAVGEYGRAVDLLERAARERCGILGLILRDPAHAHWLPNHPDGRRLLARVFDGVEL